MGCVVGLLASALALVGGWLAFEWVSPWAGLGVLVLVFLAFAWPVNRFGHRNFGGGGNTDLMGYILVFGLSAAVVVSQFNKYSSCVAVDGYVAWLQEAQATYHDENGTFASSPEALPDRATDDAFAASIEASFELASDSVFLVAVSQPMCRGGEPVEVSDHRTPPSLPAPDTILQDTLSLDIP